MSDIRPNYKVIRTKSKNVAKPNMIIIGPARSASSMTCSSIVFKGLSTVSDLTRIWEKFMPSSVHIVRNVKDKNEQGVLLWSEA